MPIVPYSLPSIDWVLAASEGPRRTGPRPARPLYQRVRLQPASKKRIARPIRVDEHMRTVDYRYEGPPRPPSPPLKPEPSSIPVIVIEDYDVEKESSDASSGGSTVGERRVRRRRSKIFVKGLCSLIVTLRCRFRAAKTVEQVEKDLQSDILN